MYFFRSQETNLGSSFGEKASLFGKSLNLNEATVRTIKKNEKEIRSAVAAGSLTTAQRAARPGRQ